MLKLCPDLECLLRILEILLSADSSRSISHERLAGPVDEVSLVILPVGANCIAILWVSGK